MTRKVRAQLASDANWKSFADRKTQLRVEKLAVIADELTAGAGR